MEEIEKMVITVTNDSTQKAVFLKDAPNELFVALQEIIDNADMDFGDALKLMKREDYVTLSRRGWNGAGQFVYLLTDIEVSDFNEFESLGDAFVLRTAQGSKQIGWVPSIRDILANDWYVVE